MSHNIKLLQYIKPFLGDYKKTSDSNVAFICPFCNHPKKKLEVNISKNDTKMGYWHCWVCGEGGHHLANLFKKLDYNQNIISDLYKLVSNNKSNAIYVKSDIDSIFTNNHKTLVFNRDFKPLYNNINDSIEYKRAIKYLENRNVTKYEIERYKIHYFEHTIINDKQLYNRIVIPTYNDEFKFISYITRDYTDNQYIPYIKPKISHTDIIFFEHLINWNLPIFLVEGVFDAIALRYNAIPLLGKNINTKLLNKLQQHQPPVYVVFDPDAKFDSILKAKYLYEKGISNVNVVLLDSDGDIADMGYEMSMEYILRNNVNINLETIMKLLL